MQVRACPVLRHDTATKKRGTRNTIHPQKVSTLLLCQRDANNYRPKANSIHLQKGHSNNISKITVHPPQEKPIQNTHNMQSRTVPIHFCLAIEENHAENKDEEIYGLQLSINAKYVATDINIYDNMGNTRGNTQ